MSGPEIYSWRSLNIFFFFFIEGLVRVLNAFSKPFINHCSVMNCFHVTRPQHPSQWCSARAGPSALLADPKLRAIPLRSHRVTQHHSAPSLSAVLSQARGGEGERERAKGAQRGMTGDVGSTARSTAGWDEMLKEGRAVAGEKGMTVGFWGEAWRSRGLHGKKSLANAEVTGPPAHVPEIPWRVLAGMV